MDINKTGIVLLMPKHQFSYWPKMEKVFIEAILKNGIYRTQFYITTSN